MAHLIVFNTDHGSVNRIDGKRCDRCGRTETEVVMFEGADEQNTLAFCTLSCWPQLVESVECYRALKKPGE